MNDCYLVENKIIRNAEDIFAGLTTESKILIVNCTILTEELRFSPQLSTIFFVSCSSNSELLIHSYNKKAVLGFEYGNSFKSIKLSGCYENIHFNSSPVFSRVPYPEEFKQSLFGVIYFLKEVNAKVVYFSTVSCGSVKYVGSATNFYIDDVNISNDMTFISNGDVSVSIISTECKELNFEGGFKYVNLNSEFKIGTVYFNLREGTMKNVSIDLQNSTIYEKLMFANASDSKACQFILKNASFASIKRLVLHQSVLSCFVMSNCDLTKTEVEFINCRIDDLLTEGVTWPFDIEVSHSNYRKVPPLEFEQKQSVYRQLKSISPKNKDVDNFLFFRRKEYDITLCVLSLRLTAYISYFLTVLCDLLGVCRSRNLPVIEKMNHNNKFAGFVMTLSNWFVLKLSSLVSVHGTSLFRPIAILILGIPFLLCIFGYYESIEQLVSLSAYVIDPTHKLEATILGSKLIINPVHSLIFKIFSSTLLFKIVMVFRKYSLSI
ncbi:TPA: hypothetical protein MIG88_27015 [Klebsiella pneumoniae]|nr:hypothetical protein [Klebsiella pneumoniae]HBX7926168.1 hypothetical protein [Klebsiella pneumoniae]